MEQSMLDVEVYSLSALQFEEEDSKALVTIDGEGVDWTSHSEEEEDYALMAMQSSGSTQRHLLQGLKKVEAQFRLIIIQDSEDEHVSQPTKEQEQRSFASTNKQVKTPRETVKNQFIICENPSVDNEKGWGYGFNARACLQGTVPTNAAMKVNTVKPIVNRVRPANLVLLGEMEMLLKPLGSRLSTKSFKGSKGLFNGMFQAHAWKHRLPWHAYQDFNGGPVAFGGSKGYITWICDKKNKVLFTDSECLVLSPKFKLPDENQVLLRIPRQNNMYSFNLENIVPSGGLACLIAKATIDESNKWHRRLGHCHYTPKRRPPPTLPAELPPLAQHLQLIAILHLTTDTAVRPSRTTLRRDFIDSVGQKGSQRNTVMPEPQQTGGDSEKEDESAQDYFVLPIWSSYSSLVK
ncbi:hypothetical protein Tco_0433198 [Tanacetum coccineum]